MSRLYPNQPVGRVSPENAKVFAALRRIPGDNTHIWMALPSGNSWRPDWMILHEQRVCFLVAVSTESLQGDLFATTPADAPGTLEAAKLKSFVDEINLDSAYLAKPHQPPIYGVVLFPNIPHEAFDQFPPHPDVALWGREMIHPDFILEALEKTGGTGVFPTIWLDLLRHKICPETRIPRDLTVTPKRPQRRDLAPRHTRQLLDLDQEYLVKADLQLSNEATNAVNDARSGKLHLVTGVAGSGKSLVLLYRAALQATLQIDARILTLSHNRPITFELQLRQERIMPGTGLHWQTFYQWCHTLLPQTENPLADWERPSWIRELIAQHPALATIPEDFLVAELDWIREQAFPDDATYLTASRRGRKRPLSSEQRSSLLRLLADYRQKLQATGRTDWPQIAENVWLALRDGRISAPLHDHIFIDEAQFFPPLWFRIIRRCLEPENGTLFLAADPTQGFLKQRTSWRDCGIEVRGHATRLRKGYRNCREILAFASAFYRRRLPDQDDDNNLPDEADLLELPVGLAPLFIHVKHQQDELTCVTNQVLDAIKQGQTPASMLVLFKSNTLAKECVERLNRAHSSTIAWNAWEPNQPRQPMVRVTTLGRATGLESQAVFLCGLDSLLEDEHKLGLEINEQEEIIRANTRKIYMALTRASRLVYIIHRHPRTREILEGVSMEKTASQLLRLTTV